ncbi:MAG: 2-oxoglutarate ferredoxin oxidoreductase subunit alpha, partial [Melioribacteraceae bacterium]|nr:2-oxoglutarate ferredoxin oxidoreductase subunit alpha [Melioribacteraceae bacterium]
GTEPWRIPKVEELEKIEVKFRTDPEGFEPYSRDENLARPWAVPGTPGLEHRIGGLEKANITGNVSHDPDNHDFMCKLRAEKIESMQKDIPDLEIDGDKEGELLVIGWGGTSGTITDAVNTARREGLTVSRAHLNYLNPFPKNLSEVLSKFDKVLIPEINLGQLATLIRTKFLKEVIQFNRMKGLPFKTFEIKEKISEILGGSNGK